MEIFQPKSIISLQNLLSQEGIYKLKKTFIKENRMIDESSWQIEDDDRGIIAYYDSQDATWKNINFEDKLVETLELSVNDIKREIDFYSAKLEGREKIKFWYSILDSLEYIEEVNPFFKGLFPACSKALDEIESYLDVRYKFRKKSNFHSKSYFVLKSEDHLKDLKKVYYFLCDEEYLDSEMYNFDEFSSVFSSRITEDKLIFECESKLIVCILDNMAFLFKNFKPTRIAQSGRFLTADKKVKKSTVINTVWYYRYRSRLKQLPDIDTQKINEFFFNLSSK